MPVTAVEELTGFPECLDGRVKTLHPKVHAGHPRRPAPRRPRRAARRARHRAVRPGRGQPLPVHRRRWPPAPRPTSASSRSTSAGPSMVRARGEEPRQRGRRHVDPARVRRGARGGARRAASPSPSARGWPPRPSRTPRPTTSPWPPGWATCSRPTDDGTGFPAWVGGDLGHGRRPALRREPAPAGGALRRRRRPGRAGPGRAAARQGDVLQQLRRRRRRLARRLRLRPSRPSRSSSTPTRAASRSAPTSPRRTRKAHACDPVSAFGGVIATNRPVTAAMAEQVAEVFTEVVVAPGVRRRRALEVLTGARRTSGCCVRADVPAGAGAEIRPISGGLLHADRATASTPPATTRRPGRWPPASPAGRRDPGRPRVRLAGRAGR